MIGNLFELKKELADQGILFSFSGLISQDLMVEMGETLIKQMQIENVNARITARVFAVLVEQIQNIIHYSAEKVTRKLPEGTEDLSQGIVTIGHEDTHYFVLTGNLVEKRDVEPMSKKLTALQSMSSEEIKAYYKKKRREDPEKTSKGAGLGFIEMARKSTEIFQFEFKEVDDSYSFFLLKTII